MVIISRNFLNMKILTAFVATQPVWYCRIRADADGSIDLTVSVPWWSDGQDIEHESICFRAVEIGF